MSDLDEIKNHLRRIGERALERDTIKHRPLICYALHPDVMSEEEYEVLQCIHHENSELFFQPNPASGGEANMAYGAGLMVFLIRLFFENSNGGEFWTLWRINNNSEKKDRILKWIDNTKWSEDYGFPDKKSSSKSLKEWLKFQCWVLRCGEKEAEEMEIDENKPNGRTATRLKNNATIFRWCNRPSYTDVLDSERWESLCPSSLDDVDDYVGELLKRHRMEYLLSLSSISASKDEGFPDELDTDEYRWLEKLWGIAPDKEKISAEWVLEKYLKTYSIKLKVLSRGLEYELKQSGKLIELKDVDPFKETEIITSSRRGKRLIPPLQFDNGAVLFKVTNQQSAKIEYKELAQICPYPWRICVLHKEAIDPELIVKSRRLGVPEQKCECVLSCRKVVLSNKAECVCSIYKLPTWKKAKDLPVSFDLLVNGRRMRELRKRPVVEVREAMDGANVSLCGDNEARVVVSCSDDNRDLIHIDIFGGVVRSSSNLEGVDLECSDEGITLKPTVCPREEDIPIEFYATLEDEKPKTVKLFLLPESWRKTWERDENWYDIIEREQREVWQRGDMRLSCPLMQLAWWWLIEEEKKVAIQDMCITDEDARLYVYSTDLPDLELYLDNNLLGNLDELHALRDGIPYVYAEDIMDNIDSIMQRNNKRDGQIEVRVKSGDESVIVMSGRYVPKYEIMPDDGCVYSRVWEDDIELIIEHEGHYFCADDETYKKVISYCEYKEYISGNKMLIPSSVLDDEHWPMGCVVIYLSDGRKESLSIGGRHLYMLNTIVDRWEGLHPIADKMRNMEDRNPLRNIVRNISNKPLTNINFIKLLPKWAEDQLSWVESHQDKVCLMRNGFFRHCECLSHNDGKKCPEYNYNKWCPWCELERSDGADSAKRKKEKKTRLEQLGCLPIGDISREKKDVILETLHAWCADEREASLNDSTIKLHMQLSNKLLKGAALSDYNKTVNALMKDANGDSVLVILCAAMYILLWRYHPDEMVSQSALIDVWSNLPAHDVSNSIGHMCCFVSYLKYYPYN